MANFTWTNAAGGNWDTESNWNPVGIPGTGANVVLPTLAGAKQKVERIYPGLDEYRKILSFMAGRSCRW
jgi:hypothetical protein